jgi:choline dehydrogenase
MSGSLNGAEFDYVIIGAGSAGCVLANRLSADPSRRVLLIEAGPPDSYIWIHIPVGYFKTMHNPRTDWCMTTEPDPGLNGRRLQWPRGRVLGGSSSINGLLYVRGQAEDYDQWRQLGCTGWSYDDVLPFFRRSEDQERGEDGFHGVGGPLAVSNMRVQRDVCDAYIDAAEEIGIPRNDDFNGARQEGAGYFQLTARNGRRCSAAVGYLNPAKRRPNLRIVTGALVRRVVIENGRATGVEFQIGEAVQRVQAAGEVLLSAGAINSPHLLELSGVGRSEVLRDIGVPLVQELSGVGENLQDHLQARSVYKCNRPTLNDEVNHPVRKVMIGLDYILRRRGPMTMGASQVCIFARTHPSKATPDVQFHIQPLSADKPGDGLHRYSAFTASVCQLRPESRGRLVPRSADPREAVAIHANYLATLTDQQAVVDGMKLARRLAATRALRPYIVEELAPGRPVQTDEELLQNARDTATTIYHPVGTCRMGNGPGAVVDARLRVHGVQALRVVDASIMPTLVSGNTNAPAIMIGEKAASMILEDARASTVAH